MSINEVKLILENKILGSEIGTDLNHGHIMIHKL